MPAAPARFTGFPTQAFDFYVELEANNTKSWWSGHKGEYEEFVRGPMEALVAELADEFGDAKIFRPYRDARFSKDKTPIKDHQGAVVHLEDGIGYYVQVGAHGLMAAGGWYSSGGEQIEHYREAVDGPRGAELEKMVATLSRKFEYDGRALKTKPRGYDIDHPRIDLLRNKAVLMSRMYDVEPWVSTRKALDVVRKDWRAVRPLMEWLADNVGPAEDPAQGE